MRDRTGCTVEKSASDQELNSFVLPENSIDALAWSVYTYKGAVFGCVTTSQGWDNLLEPRPPRKGESQGGHAIYAMGYHMHNGQKCIIAKSSYNEVSEHHIKEDYFSSGYTFNGWTLIPKGDIMYSLDIKEILSKDGRTVYLAIGCPTMDVLEAVKTIIRSYGGTIKPQIKSTEL